MLAGWRDHRASHLEELLPRVFYRLLTADPPSLDDFRSYAEIGKPPPVEMQRDEDFLRRWSGLSVYDTHRAARRLSQARRWKRWEYIGVLQIPDDAQMLFEGPDEHGHWNLYGAAPEYLRNVCLTRVIHAPSVAALLPDR